MRSLSCEIELKIHFRLSGTNEWYLGSIQMSSGKASLVFGALEEKPSTINVPRVHKNEPRDWWNKNRWYFDLLLMHVNHMNGEKYLGYGKYSIFATQKWILSSILQLNKRISYMHTTTPLHECFFQNSSSFSHIWNLHRHFIIYLNRIFSIYLEFASTYL